LSRSATVEFYGFFLYANAAALVFAPLFFPAASPGTQQLGAWATFAIAFLARPLGGVLFGHLGDRHGRHVGLAASLLLMGGSTVAIGLLPTFGQIGWLATTLLCAMRLGQGLALGGEWGGAVLIAVERAPAARRTLFGMVPQLGAPLGLLLADGMFLVLDLALPPEEFAWWGWRIPFLATAPLILLASWARQRLAPARSASSSQRARLPARAVLGHWPALLAGTLAAMLGFVLFYLSSSFALA
jgi:MFS family permease